MDKTECSEVKYPFAVKYEKVAYWGCPHCGGNCWGAINPTAPPEDYIYRCHGTSVGMMTYFGCGRLFRLPPEAKKYYKNSLESFTDDRIEDE